MSKSIGISGASDGCQNAQWAVPHLWINPDLAPPDFAKSQFDISIEDVKGAADRLARFAPALVRLFPETASIGGIIESPLTPLVTSFYADEAALAARCWIKCDHALAIAGSIKARGGIHEVLEFAETLALRHRLIAPGADYSVLADTAARALYSQYEISVGSTGNLGMSIGLMASKLGFRVTVHMSADAKQWKKDKLRENGVQVVEHAGDYARAVEVGREQANANPHGYFVDDEQSRSLFLGYSVAALRLATQMRDAGVMVDATHPLFVYLPCGVGGAPAGITFGLKCLFGHNVHCFFVEPMASPCFMVRMQHTDRPGISVYDVGLDNCTEADGLAVPVASELAIKQMRSLLSGVLTTRDDTMFLDLLRLHEQQGIKVEPSAAAAFSGPRMLFGTEAGRAYLHAQGLQPHLAQANHIVWSTGGLFVPAAEFDKFLARGRSLTAVSP
ncbi:D-serine ammonia-lyase [Variovorax sp. M-6]|uniref:D-serine ammonia-lyase n=1 Tax=Variovorax sp. M-6 TaxID=3233041 RepID=UPI003F95CC0F